MWFNKLYNIAFIFTHAEKAIGALISVVCIPVTKYYNVILKAWQHTKMKWPPWWSWPTAFLWLINSRGSFRCITMTWILCKDMEALSVMRFLCHTYIHTYLNIVQTMTWIFIVQRYGSSSSDEVHTFLCHTYTYIRARWIFRLGEFGPKG